MLPRMIREYVLHVSQDAETGGSAPHLVHVSTPSYCGTHIDGFHAAVRAVVENAGRHLRTRGRDHINLFPGMVSAADIRYLKEIAEDFEISNPSCCRTTRKHSTGRRSMLSQDPGGRNSDSRHSLSSRSAAPPRIRTDHSSAQSRQRHFWRAHSAFAPIAWVCPSASTKPTLLPRH